MSKESHQFDCMSTECDPYCTNVAIIYRFNVCARSHNHLKKQSDILFWARGGFGFLCICHNRSYALGVYWDPFCQVYC